MMMPAFNPAASVAAFGDWVYPMLKHQADLDRYATIIEATRPTAVVETGTRNGASAEWFASRPGVQLVVTVDIQPTSPGPNIRYLNKYNPHHPDSPGKIVQTVVHTLKGSSTMPDVVRYIAELVKDHRVMVSLDSDHSRDHVFREIELYAPLVSPDCYLVVEDGIIAWLPPDVFELHGCGVYTGTVMDAVRQADLCRLLDLFDHDEALEGAHGGVTMFPAGWWRKRPPGESRTRWTELGGGLYWAPLSGQR